MTKLLRYQTVELSDTASKKQQLERVDTHHFIFRGYVLDTKKLGISRSLLFTAHKESAPSWVAKSQTLPPNSLFDIHIKESSALKSIRWEAETTANNPVNYIGL